MLYQSAILEAGRSRSSGTPAAAWIATMLLPIVVMLCFGESVRAQVYQEIPLPPSPVLPPIPDSTDSRLDPFRPPEQDNLLLRPWHTITLPIGTWGTQTGWDINSTQSTTIRRYRHAALQNVEITGGFLGRDSDNSLFSYAAASVMGVAPLGHEDRLLVVIPRFRVDWNGSSSGNGLPDTLYSTSLDIGIRWKISADWSLIAGVQPGWYSDGYSGNNDFRLGGLLLFNHEIFPETLTLSAGIARLDQNDFDIIPAAGMTWIPNSDTRLDLLFPRPKISRRIGHVPWLQEDWVYLVASFGGGTWAVRRESGADDELTMRDWRLSLGVERILDGGSGIYAEVGYVFDRHYEYESEGVRQDFRNSFLFETSIRF
jgi:hypothetical protein